MASRRELPTKWRVATAPGPLTKRPWPTPFAFRAGRPQKCFCTATQPGKNRRADKRVQHEHMARTEKSQNTSMERKHVSSGFRFFMLIIPK